MPPEDEWLKLEAEVERCRRKLPTLSSPRELLQLTPDDDDELCQLVVTGEAADLNLSGMTFSGLLFDRCSLTNADLQRCTFRNCIWLDSNISNSRLNHSSWLDCRLSGVKGVGVDFTAARLDRCRWRQCLFPYANFTAARLRRQLIARSDFSEAVFSETTFKYLELHESNFTRATFFKTPLEGIDFTSSRIDALRLSDNFHELRGARINVSQAIDLARRLGIEVE